MKKIHLRGKTYNKLYAIVDDEDYIKLSKFKWFYNKGYAIRTLIKNKNKKIIKMHREVMGALNHTKPIDHIDRNPLNNTKNNLRFCTYFENSRNTGIYKNNTSGFKGVYWHKNRKKWQSSVIKNGKWINLGIFEDKNLAIEARKNYNKNEQYR